MKLYIAEKPSLGRALADVLPKPHRRADGCIYLANGDCVSWCVGHLLEQVDADVYDPKYKQWRFEHLPIIPQQWQLKPKASSRKQLTVLRKLIKTADQLVHVGDPDREGQLLVDQVIEFCKVPAKKRDNTQRCLISDLNPAAVERALSQLRNNREFVPLSTSALARSRADWLYGINMTRALTLQGKKVGYQGVLSVGRVQTPLLGLVVRRDEEIANFVAKPFYQVLAHLSTDKGESFKAIWLPSEACAQWQDEEGRVLSRALADNVASRIQGQTAVVNASSRRVKKQPPPLPYNLSSLQIDAAKRFGLSAKQVLDCCQNLYERHKLLTYPRSDSRYLPVEHYADRAEIISAIKINAAVLADAVEGVDPGLKSKAWNDSKVDAHHAIIPTAKKTTGTALSQQEKNIYELVARQYLMQFYPPYEYSDSEINLTIAGGQFRARARQAIAKGWKQLLAERAEEQKNSLNQQLPVLQKGQQCHCEQGQVIEKQTTAPKHFDDASLLAAMTGVVRYVQDPEIRKVLKETDGLGTEATRAGIIELLFSRQFLQRQGKLIKSTVAGKGLINSLPAIATYPDMTANWEMMLNAISLKQGSYQQFMQPLQQRLTELVEQSQQVLPVGLKDIQLKKKPWKKTAKKHPSATRKKRSA